MNPHVELAGQLLTIGFDGQECGSALKNLLQTTRPGGVIYFQRNIASEDQFRALVSQTREILGDSRPFQAIDQEGGEVDRFRALIAPLPSARDAAVAGLGRELGDLAGRELAAFGLNLDFAPVLDLGSDESRSVLGSRTGGETAQEVIRFAERFLLGLAGWHVVGCGKHFPGLGSGRKDSHIGMPVLERAREELWQNDLLPFRTLRDDLPMIMVAHAWYPDVERALAPGSASADDPVPASLSSNIVTGLLRGRMGYEGIVVCDDLEMGGALEGRSIEEAALAAVRAGCDMLLVCRHAENVACVHAALVREFEKDASFRELGQRASARMMKLRRRFAAGTATSRVNYVDLQALRQEILRFSDSVAARLAQQAEAVTPKH
jgi:beta-N-acetylhexosaminidase